MDPGKRTKETTSGQIKIQNGKIGMPFEQKQANPQWAVERLNIFTELYNKQQELLNKIDKPAISIKLKDGTVKEGVCFQTTPEEIMKKCVPQKVQKEICVAKVIFSKKYNFGDINTNVLDPADEEMNQADDEKKPENVELYDLHRPLEGDCSIEFVTFDEKEGKSTFWHSSAHILGYAIEQIYGAHLCIGPPLEQGFYYDAYMGKVFISDSEYKDIEKVAKGICEKKEKFERVFLTKQQALELFSHNPFKVQLIQAKVPENSMTSAYKCGTLIDLCTGPHLPNTGFVKAFKVVKNSSAYWLSNSENDSLQRVYAVSFPKADLLKEYERIQEELKKRDHRNIGTKQELFFFHKFSPGCAFFYPKGAHIYNRLQELIRHQYNLRGYQEVVTPNLFDLKLWKQSGHWDKYKENMFTVKDKLGEDDEIHEHGLKPMNCPSHCLMFDSVLRSYRELPIRFADFGVLHRNELAGALTGLTRVRRFQQDDSHTFCTIDQIKQEIMGILDFVDYIYSSFGFKYKFYLSTRPKKYLGELKDWDKAEALIKEALIQNGKDWGLDEGGGAFYGPKIDIKLCDAFNRWHQCGTVQLDFQLPNRFNLQYRDKDDKHEEEKKEEKHEKEESGIPNLTQQEQEIAKELNNPNRKALCAIVQKGEKAKKEQSALIEEIKKKFNWEDEKAGHAFGYAKKDLEKQEADIQLKKQQAGQKKKEKPEEKKIQEENKEEKKEEKKEIIEENYDNQPIKPGFARVCMIHKAVLGSLERFFAILTEQTAGKWPFWLNPNQVAIIPISNKFKAYADQIEILLKQKGYQCKVDFSGATIDKKIRNNQIDNYNYILCVGEKEVQNQTVNIRERDGGEKATLGEFTLFQMLQKFEEESKFPVSKVQLEIDEKARLARNDDELVQLNEQLRYQVFLEGEGFVLGNLDKSTYEKLKDVSIEKEKYPNIYRWKLFVEKSI